MTTTTATLSPLPSGAYLTTPNGVIVSVSLSVTAAPGTVWQNGAISYTEPYPAGDTHSFLPLSVNDNGWVVGTTSTNGTSYDVSHGVVWENGTPVSLGSETIIATGINNLNQVIGSVYIGTDQNGFVWQNGVKTILPSLSEAAVAGTAQYANALKYDATSSAQAINSSGEIVGASNAGLTASQLYSSATLWKNGQAIDLGALPGGGMSDAYSINDAGQVVGVAAPSGTGGLLVAVTFQNGVATQLPGLTPNTASTARYISDSGVILGDATAADGSTHAVMWKNGVITDLNSLLPANSGVLTSAFAFDADGNIVTSGGLLTLPGVSAPLSLGISATAANLTIDGSTTEGTTVIFSGKASDYSISASGSTITVTDTGTGRSSTDHLTNVTALHFSDVTDIVAATPGTDGAVTTGNITELYGAVFGRLPDVPGLAYYQAELTANPAIPLLTFAQWFLASPEYVSAHSYAQSTAGDDKFITDSYTNLLKRAPEAAALPYYENVINQFTQGLTPGTSAYAAAQAEGHALVLVYFSASGEFLGDVQITAQNPSSAQHWLLLH